MYNKAREKLNQVVRDHPSSPQAQEALIQAQIPQKATLSRASAKIDVVYAGKTPSDGEIVRVTLHDGFATPTGPQGSHQLSSMVGADGFAISRRDKLNGRFGQSGGAHTERVQQRGADVERERIFFENGVRL